MKQPKTDKLDNALSLLADAFSEDPILARRLIPGIFSSIENNREYLKKIQLAMETRDRMKALSNQELVRECLSSGAADYDVVIEMMDRLHPGWEKE